MSNGYHHNQQRESEDVKKLKEVKKDFGDEYENILNPNRDENKFINKLKEFMDKNARQISTSQLRNVFSKIKNLNEKKYEEIYSLRPKLAYVYGRSDSNAMKKLIVLLDDQIQKVKSSEQLKMFKSFFESVIAYHKFYGGKN